MKVLICLSIIINIQSCLSMVVKKKILDYKMNDSVEIEIHSIGGGATAPDYLRVIKKDLSKNKNTTIKVLDGFTDNYKFQLNKLNDSIINLKLTDTAYFKGKVLNYRININQTDTTFNKYK